MKVLKLILALSLLLFVACGKEESKITKSNEVTVYSSHPSELLTTITDNFSEKTGIKVNVVAAGTGEILKRIQAESENPLGDVIWGGGAESLNSFKEYFAPYKTSSHDRIDPLFRDPQDKWFGFALLPMVIIYNTDLVAGDDIPTSWADTINPKWKGKVAMASPVKSGSSYTITATILTAFGKDNGVGYDFLKKFIANLDGKILGSSSGVPKGVVDKEYSIGLAHEKGAIKYKNAGGHLGIVYPSEGTSAVPDAAALIKGAKNEENAKLFLDYIVSKDVQKTLATDFKIRGVRDDVAAPEGLLPLSEIKLVEYDFAWASDDKKEIITRWKNIVSGKE